MTDVRPDIVIFCIGNGKNVDLDMSVAYPWSKGIISPGTTLETMDLQ